MKKVAVIVLALIFATMLAFAQAPAPTGKPAGQGAQQPSAQPGQQPATGQPAQQPGTGQAGQPTAPAEKRQPQAKTQEEFKAYQDAAAKPDPASMEAAADEFAAKFPNSELKTVLYQRVMSLYQNANNADKTVEIGRKVLQLDPDNTAALVTVASVLSNRTRESDLDRDERYAEATKDADKALQLVDAGQGIPAGTPPDRVEMFKSLVRSMAYASLGTIEFNKKNFAQAEQNLRKSVEIPGIQPDPVSWLQLSMALDRQSKYPDALQAAKKCVEVAQGHPAGTYCQQEQARLEKLVSNPPAATPKPVPTAPQTAPATAPSTAPSTVPK